MNPSLQAAASTIRALAAAPRRGALLVALSGIDGSGKSTLSQQLAAQLEASGVRVAAVGVDPWQNPQSVRFGGKDPGVHFYRHAIRFGELFDRLVRPLVKRRSIHLRVPGIRTDRDVYDEIDYRFEDVDVVLLEGIFLLQRRLDVLYDLCLWVDCSFEAALRRALARNAERLPPDRLRSDYLRIYRAAQRYHLAVDAPHSRADFTIPNDADLH
jgi:uridine kinase